MIEISFRGRGGQGAVVASEILGRAFFMEGKYPQAFSVFGGERRGAPVMGFLRVDEEPILLKCQIQHPNQLIVFDLSLVDEAETSRELQPDALVLVNSNRATVPFRELTGFRMAAVDAGAIARSLGLGSALNTAMLGAYVRFTNLIRLETLIEAVKLMAPAKVEENIQAIRKAFELVSVYEPGVTRS